MVHDKSTTTIVPMPELDNAEGKAQLTLRTSKGYSRLISSGAHVEFAKPKSTSGFSCTSFTLYGDFRKHYSGVKGLATQKNLDNHHRNTFTPEVIAALKLEVLAFYAAKAKEDAA